MCPSAHPGRSRPVQGEARWLEKPCLCSYIPVLTATPQSATRRKLLLIVFATKYLFFLPLIHLPSSPLSLLGRMELTTRAPSSTHKGSVMSIPPEHFTHKGSVLSIPPDHFSNHPLYLERHKRIFWGN